MVDILVYNEELSKDGIVWHHLDIPDNLWVIGTEIIAVEMSNTITPAVSIDATFNNGGCNTMPLRLHTGV